MGLSAGQPIELLCIQDEVGGNSQGLCAELASTSMFGCNFLTGCCSQVPHLALRAESTPHCHRVLRCGWWEKWG